MPPNWRMHPTAARVSMLVTVVISRVRVAAADARRRYVPRVTLTEQQEEVCRRHGASFVAAPSSSKVGIGRNVAPGAVPINALRHPVEGDVCGWYIWAGDELSEDPEFFQPVHVAHLAEHCPELLRYLGLAPGWRVLLAGDFADVWFDESLLNVTGR